MCLTLTLTCAACKAKRKIARISEETEKSEVYKDTRKDTLSIIETKNEEDGEELVIASVSVKYDTLQRPTERRVFTAKRTKAKMYDAKTEVQRFGSETVTQEAKETENAQIRTHTEADPLKWWRGALIFLWILLILVFVRIIREIKK